jgi:hypothetical protein
VSEVTPPPATPRRPFEGWGAAAARGLGKASATLVRVTGKLFGELHQRGTIAYGDFRARPEHSRYRAYAFGSYGLLLAATLASQLYTADPLHAYVRVQVVAMPALTQIFVRNDSSHDWKQVRLTLNGIYGFEVNTLTPGAHVLLPVNRFALFDASGKATFAPRTIPPQQLRIECDRGQMDEDLTR